MHHMIIPIKNIFNNTFQSQSAIATFDNFDHFESSSKVLEMQATSLCSHVFLSYPLSVNLLQGSAPHKLFTNTTTTTRRSLIYASKRDSFGHHYDGNLVDENMILLRMRIREIEMVEMKGKATSDWTEWEKKYFENYGSVVCAAVGLLQRVLMNTRPSFALGMLALVMLSMSMSTLQVGFHLIEFAKGII